MCQLFISNVVIVIFLNVPFSSPLNAIDNDFNENHNQEDDLVVLSVDRRGDIKELDHISKTELKNLTDGIPIELMLRERAPTHWSNIPHDFEDKVKQEVRYQKHDAREQAKIQKEHQEKLAFIREFLSNAPVTVMYVKQEIKRINETGVIKDELREMVHVLDKQPYYKVKNAVIDCYTKFKAKLTKRPEGWKHDTNNLVINIFQDPENDGVQ